MVPVMLQLRMPADGVAIAGTTWFSSATHITNLKALTTDKTQSFGTGTFGQQGATNTLQALEALARIAEAVRPTP